MFMRVCAVVTVSAVLIVLAACGGGDDQAAPWSGLSSPGSGDASVESDVIDSFEASEPAVDGEGDTASAVSSAGFERRVIRNGELVVSVSDVQRSVRHARDVVEDRGGYVASSNARTRSDGMEIAELTLEVPAAEFDPILGILRDGPYVVRVEHESTSSQDVTEEYVDLGSRLANLESTEARFVALLEEASTINDILSVEREISRIRGEIEQIKGRMNYLEQRTDNSRIHVAFEPEDEPVTIAGWQFTPGETAREAWNASMRFLGAFADGAITITVFFWWAWPLLAISIGMFWRFQRRRAASHVEPIGT